MFVVYNTNPFLLTVAMFALAHGDQRLQKFRKFQLADSKVIHSEIIIVGLIPSVLHCLIECGKNGDCVSVNYNTESTICELNTHELFGASVRLESNQSNWQVFETEPCGLAWKNGSYCHYMLKSANEGYWNNCLALCRAIGLDMVKIENELELAAFNADTSLAFAGLIGFIWIGGHEQDGQWVWTDGSPMSFRTPVDLGGGGDCARAMVNQDEGAWEMHDCSTRAACGCQRR